MSSDKSVLFLLASVAMEETKKTYARKIYQWKFWRQKKEKWIKTKKGELTHFLGHYPRFSPTLFPASPQCRDRRGRLSLLKKHHPPNPSPNGEGRE